MQFPKKFYTNFHQYLSNDKASYDRITKKIKSEEGILSLKEEEAYVNKKATDLKNKLDKYV